MKQKINPKKGYIEIVSDILKNSEFKKLSNFYQHLGTSRLLHSIHVSYITWKIASFFNLDSRSAARAGLLHDFCLYDFHEKNLSHKFQLIYHPIVAAKTSKKHFELNEKENKAILSHMFPLGPMPTSRVAWIITLADKMCAIAEFALGFYAIIKANSYILKPILSRI